MDDDFLTKLKSISAKDVLADQRPATSRLRSSRARSSAMTVPAAADVPKPVQHVNRIEESPEEASGPILTLSELLSKQPVDDTGRGFGAPLSSSDEPTFFKPTRAKNDGEMGNFTRAARIGSAMAGNHVTRPPSSKPSAVSSFQESSAQYIPDLNEIQAEEILHTVATAPEMEAEKITSLRELDADLARLRTFSVVRGVDMRKLARFMLPEKKLVLYSDQEEDMRSITYEQLYSDLLPLINGKNLISFDFSSLKGQRTFDGFPFLTEAGIFTGLSQKDGKRKTMDPQMLQKLKDYANASVEKFGRKQDHGATNITLPYLEDILRKARDKYEQKERLAGEKKPKVTSSSSNG